MDRAEALALVESRLDLMLKPGRARHCREVARLSGELCAIHGLEPSAGALAGLAHDLCKELPYEEQLGLARAYESHTGARRPEAPVLGRAILHGPAAAGWLLGTFGPMEGEILEAVACHTIGARGMGDLARIVYVADKLEPGRVHVDPDFRRRCLVLPPAESFAAVHADLIRWLRSRGHPIAEESLALLEESSAKGGRP